MDKPEFDQYAAQYAELLRDPIRDRFAPGSSFFFERKWILLEHYLIATARDISRSAWLDVGCGQGDLLRLGASRFGRVSGCDLSREMMEACQDLDVVPQPGPTELPFDDRSFDVVTAVCVFHHVDSSDQLALMAEIARVLKPSGTACIIEHNPYNPLTQLIVSRTPVDADARLLRPASTRRLLSGAALEPRKTQYFLYVPEFAYRRLPAVENLLSAVPMGGQYAVFADKL